MTRKISNSGLKQFFIERLKALIAKIEQLLKERSARNFGGGPDNLTFVADLGGSTGAKQYKDKYGNLYVWKEGGGNNKEEHIRNEQAADDFYRACGINVPDGKIFDTSNGPVKLTRYIEDGESLDKWWSKATPAQKNEMRAKLQKGYAADILLGNWDVIGLSGDNIIIDKDGTPWRIDNGGALGFRAQGVRKTAEEWGNGMPDDLWTMTGRGDKIGGSTATKIPVYYQNTGLLHTINEIDGEDWSKALNTLPPKDRKVVEKRLDETRQLAARGNDFVRYEYTQDYTEQILDHSYILSKDGFREELPSRVDEKKGDFGNLRRSTMKQSVYADVYDKTVKAAKTINYHQKQGNTNYNQTTLQECYALIPDLEKKAKAGDKDAQYYLSTIKDIQKAEKNNTTVQTVTPTKNTKSQRCIQEILEEHVNKAPRSVNKDPYDFIETSAEEQASSSYSEGACRFKLVQLQAMGIDVTDTHSFNSVDDVLLAARRKGYYVGNSSLGGTPEEQEDKDRKSVV